METKIAAIASDKISLTRSVDSRAGPQDLSQRLQIGFKVWTEYFYAIKIQTLGESIMFLKTQEIHVHRPCHHETKRKE